MLTIIGIGSPMPGDQLGWQVIDQLQQLKQRHDIELDSYGPLQPANQIQSTEQIQSTKQIQLIKLDRPGSGLLDYLDVEGKVILIDAIMSEQHDFGDVIRLDAHQLADTLDTVATEEQPSLLSSHGFGLKEALQLAKQLKCLPQECVIMGLNLYRQVVEDNRSDGDHSDLTTETLNTEILDLDLSLLLEQLATEIEQGL